jgi:serine/threonine protein kinase
METVDQGYIIMEHSSRAELLQYIQQTNCLHENEAHGVYKQIVCAIKYCHKKGMIHTHT